MHEQNKNHALFHSFTLDHAQWATLRLLAETLFCQFISSTCVLVALCTNTKDIDVHSVMEKAFRRLAGISV